MVFSRSLEPKFTLQTTIVFCVVCASFFLEPLVLETQVAAQLQRLKNAERVHLRPISANQASIQFKQQLLQNNDSAPKFSNQSSSRAGWNQGRQVKFQATAQAKTELSSNGLTPSSIQSPRLGPGQGRSNGLKGNALTNNSDRLIISPSSNNLSDPRVQNGIAGSSIPGSNLVPQQGNSRSNLLSRANNRLELTLPKTAQVEFQNQNGFVTMVAKNATVADVLNVLANKEKISFVLSGDSAQTISFSLQNVPASQALTSVLAVSGHTWTERAGIVYVTPNTQASESTVTPEYTGKIVKVFGLDYASAKNVNEVVKGMLSTSGQSYVVESDKTDNRKTNEQIVVEDLPGVIQRVEQYILQIDQPPRQVLIEAFVLEIDLNEDDKHGVNFEHIAKMSGNDLKLGTIGITPTATSTFLAEIDAPNLKGIIDALKTSNDTRTLASPKVMVINGQESRLQVGQQLGFRVIQQNGNTSMEDVRFIDVGVVLSVTPRISRDGRILMNVQPEVSNGKINIDTGLPEEETSEVQTSVLLSNGKGMVIGGLIQEKDSITESKVPVLGDLKGIGGLFRRTAKEKSRSEIVFVLIPRIVENDNLHAAQNEFNQLQSNQRDQSEYIRSTTPLFDSEKCRLPRPAFDPPLSPVHGEYNDNHDLGYPHHYYDHQSSQADIQSSSRRQQTSIDSTAPATDIHQQKTTRPQVSSRRATRQQPDPVVPSGRPEPIKVVLSSISD
ncbi:MAG: hypothetical protein VX438_12535 [Planctomycetota bacterium]|nr:hypothetical protein [Planctomycetota bacterium]